MKNTDYSLSSLDYVISSDSSLEALLGMIEDMDLEITDIRIV